MKMANGDGSVYKLSGKRRNPWMVRKTAGWEIDKKTGKSKQKYITIGYYPTRAEGLAALVHFNENPYDIKRDSVTFEELYEKWSSEHFEKIVPSAARTWKSAYNYCEPLLTMRMKDIRVVHLEKTIQDASVGSATKGRIKSLFNQMYAYAMKHEIVDKDYAQLCDSVKRERPTIERVPYADDDIQKLWDYIDFPFVDMVLIGIYSGWRPQELAILKITDIDLEQWTFYGGLKTDAGRNRYVPIHPVIRELVMKNYNKAIEMGSEYLFNDEDGQQGTYLTYDKYRGRFNKINKKLGMTHKPHDTRHTFITKAKLSNVDEYVLKLIVGHAIEDVTEKIYTHRTIEQLHNEIKKIN